MVNQDPDPTNLVLQSIEEQCNGLPKDTLVTRLVQFAAVQTAEKYVSVVPLDSPVRPETPHASTACPILPAQDRILLHVSQETIPNTDNYQVNKMSTLPKKIVESTNIQANDTKSISVHFPRSVCNPKTSEFRGFTRKSRRVSRFYIGGIDKYCSSEDAMRLTCSNSTVRVFP
ncbi:unnamed protein product [Mytilus coruscus]|uniref:Uncharacterized protein n=1 Tax=Mytilus coruscus TaxID=42192 RepID=A0A6J8AZ37_MYTCO|nr:unnamed protein product [Mytilus coruscus]